MEGFYIHGSNNVGALQDYVILDEGHKIKNPSKTTKAVHGIPARHRFIVTGTPIQNNLKVSSTPNSFSCSLFILSNKFWLCVIVFFCFCLNLDCCIVFCVLFVILFMCQNFFIYLFV